MTLLAITSQTWLVTGLGFGIVLLLLTVFIFLMKALGWIMQPHTKQVSAAKQTATAPADEATKAAIATTLALNEDDNDLAAVAFTINMYYYAHDIEPAPLKMKNHATAWNIRPIL